MKKLLVTKADFDEVVYPLIATEPAKDMATLRVAIRVLDKLEAVAAAGEEKPGQPRLHVLVEGEATFEFEEDEAAYIAQKLEMGISRISVVRAKALLPMIAALRG